MSTGSRKADHLRINLERDVAGKGVTSGFESYRLINCALPEIDLADVDTSCTLLGKPLRAPIVISCMTGGTPQAREINRTLARVACQYGFALGLGSGRALIEHPALLDTFAVRDAAPGVLLFANLGAVQLNKGYGLEDCRRLVDLIEADALVLHLNALQEALQPEGDTAFRGLLKQIARLCAKMPVPVVVKEVGWGIDAPCARALLGAGVAAIDLAGAGGTSWSEVERFRAAEPWRARVAGQFSGWGIPTAQALRSVRRALPTATIVASGGVRTGMDVLKALALGADAAGIAGPFLRAAAQTEDAAADLARELHEVLRTGMFALGARTIGKLRRTKRIEHARDR
ncbi:MAG: type 2 isopentenyl-diphosphate Delta-isomerase [Candidatus Baltobacteraceae bacterium]